MELSREQLEAAAAAVASADLTAKLGAQTGPKTAEPPSANDVRLLGGRHAQLAQAAKSRVVGFGTLVEPNGSSRTFRVLSPWGQYLVHPDDVAWLIPKVQGLMRIQPAWARARRQLYVGGKWVNVPESMGYIDTLWTCPECLPKRIVRYSKDAKGYDTQTLVGYDNDTCGPCGANVAIARGRQDAVDVRRQRDGYDDRVFLPWSSTLGNREACFKGQVRGEGAVCLPFLVFDDAQSVCSNALSGIADAQRYWVDFWADVGDAVRKYNARSKGLGDSAVGAKRAEPEVELEAPPRLALWPAALAAMGVGISAVLLWPRRKR